jgi:hypothetical protein
MSVIFGKYNSLANFVTVINFQPICHEDIQDFPNRILIKKPFIQRRGSYALGEIAVLIFKGILISLLVFFR